MRTRAVPEGPYESDESDFRKHYGAFGFPSGSDGKILPAIKETRVQSLGQEDPLEKGMATRSSILV